MKKTKRLLSLFLTIALLMTLTFILGVSLTVSANDSPFDLQCPWCLNTDINITGNPASTCGNQGNVTISYVCKNSECGASSEVFVQYPPELIPAHVLVETTAPKCVENGVSTCSVCGTKKAIPLAFGQHIWGDDWSVTTAATTAAEGVETRYCQRTGCNEFETRSIAKLPAVPPSPPQSQDPPPPPLGVKEPKEPPTETATPEVPDSSGDKKEEIVEEKTPLGAFDLARGKKIFNNPPSAEKYVNPYKDVSKNDWFAEAARIMNQLGIMIGSSSKDTFKPNELMNRYVLATILYRLEGEHDLGDEEIDIYFKDVKKGEWYSNSVIWAYGAGLIKGFPDGTFKGQDLMTLEHIVLVLYRYAEGAGFDVSARADLSKLFKDANKVSDWALESMQWAAATGLLIRETKLEPQGTVTRSEIAVMMNNFLFEVFKK
jgi:Fe-S cluster biosynthesis and repair protein YggX